MPRAVCGPPLRPSGPLSSINRYGAARGAKTGQFAAVFKVSLELRQSVAPLMHCLTSIQVLTALSEP